MDLLWNLIGMNGPWCSFSLSPISFNLLVLWRIWFSSLISKTNESPARREREREWALETHREEERWKKKGRGGVYKSSMLWLIHLGLEDAANKIHWIDIQNPHVFSCMSIKSKSVRSLKMVNYTQANENLYIYWHQLVMFNSNYNHFQSG